MLRLDPHSTALVLIDIQKGILSLPMAPHTAEQVVRQACELARQCKAAGIATVHVRVSFSQDYADKPNQPTDTPMVLPPGGLPADWAEITPALASIPADIAITKRHWSAFYGTELDLQLRRRGISTIILGGLMTNFGVESTARDAWQHNYGVVIAEDVCSSFAPELHRFSIDQVMPRIARVSGTASIIAALSAAAGERPTG